MSCRKSSAHSERNKNRGKIFHDKTFPFYDNKAHIKRVVKKSKTNENWKWKNEKMIPWHEGSREMGKMPLVNRFFPSESHKRDENCSRWNRKKGKNAIEFTSNNSNSSVEKKTKKEERKTQLNCYVHHYITFPATKRAKQKIHSDESFENIYLFTQLEASDSFTKKHEIKGKIKQVWMMILFPSRRRR